MNESILRPHDRSESYLHKNGAGYVGGVIVNSHTSGTLKLVDGLYNGVAASSTITSAGACVPADYAVSTLTSNGTAATDGDTLTVGATGGTSITYRAKTVPIAPNDVAIGSTADGSAFLANLQKAINGTGLGNGTDYFKGTTPSPDIYASTPNSTTMVVVFKTIGAGGNAYTTTASSVTLSWTSTVLAGGVTAAGATITLDTTVYMAVVHLAEHYGMASVADQVLWVTNEADFIINLKRAINGSGLPGTDYSSATINHPSCWATTISTTQLTVVAKSLGTQGNSIITTTTLANYSWTSTVLASGTGTKGKLIMNTFTFPAGSGIYKFPNEIAFETALLAIVGGTLDYTLLLK